MCVTSHYFLHVDAFSKQREGGGGRGDRQTDSQTDRQTDRQRETDRQSDRQRQRGGGREMGREREGRETDRDRQIDIQTDRRGRGVGGGGDVEAQVQGETVLSIRVTLEVILSTTPIPTHHINLVLHRPRCQGSSLPKSGITMTSCADSTQSHPGCCALISPRTASTAVTATQPVPLSLFRLPR